MSDPNSNSNSGTVSQQILADAGFYPPLIYDILSRYSSLSTQPDSLSDQYVPITDVLPPANSQTLPFVVGFIPPAATIPQGSQLSREASVAANSNNSPPNTPLSASNPGLGSGNNAGTATGFSSAGAAFIANHEGFVPNAYNDNAGLPTIGYGHLIQPGEDFTGGITRDQAQTLLQKDATWAQTAVQQNVTVPLSQNQFDMLTSYAYSVGANGFKNSTSLLNAVNSSDFSTAASILQNSTRNVTGAVDPNLVTIRNAEAVNFTLPDGSALHPVYGNVPIPSSSPTSNTVGADVANPGSWNNQSGSAAAQTAAQQSDSVANTSLNQTTQGTQFLTQQTAQANALNILIQQMSQAPPLRMLVNPRSFKNNLEKVISDGNWGRNGPIIEHWGENLDKIEGSGKLAAFYALDVQQTPIGGSASWPGMTRMARNYSTAYQNFLSLYLIYRSNAGIWTQDYINCMTNGYPTSGPVNLAMLGSIYIYYDNILYVGSFDNFTITESDESPFSLEYSFTFTVRAWFCLDQQQDPELTFNAPVNGTPAPGIQPQPGSIPTQSSISQFGPSAGQALNAASGSVGAVLQP